MLNRQMSVFLFLVLIIHGVYNKCVSGNSTDGVSEPLPKRRSKFIPGAHLRRFSYFDEK